MLRIYRPHEFSSEEIKKIMLGYKTQFDSGILEAFLQIVQAVMILFEILNEYYYKS
ncbi:hypothetical protein [Caloranaerobacter sp. DY30410]|uniref:hypothetical protein n=1 Tax=Caloranaerobacter sp. DY30410 TaxID=3238305 RepID=UPI003D033868